MPESQERHALQTALQHADPALLRVLPILARTADELYALLVLAEAFPPFPVEDYPEFTALRVSLVDVWQELNSETAEAYAATLGPVAGSVRKVHPWKVDPNLKKHAAPPRRIGPYEADTVLGQGGAGLALAARHVETGRRVTLKLLAGGEGLVHDWLGGQWPAPFIEVYEWGVEQQPYGSLTWVAREPANETWHDYMARRRGGPVSHGEALSVFTIACEGVAELHSRQVFRWSAHAGNLFRVGDRWKLGDMGRCCMASGPDDPRLRRCLALEDRTALERSQVLDLLDGGPWNGWARAGIFPRDPDREHRLKLDDAAMLAGLLLDLLGLNRWEVFYQAIRKRPYCTGRYKLTGNHRTDTALSAVLNRAWLGDAGGALAVANGGGIDGYADPLELLADVREVFRK